MAADRFVGLDEPLGVSVIDDGRMLDPIDLVAGLIETTPTPWEQLGAEHYARIAATAQGLLRYEARSRSAIGDVRAALAVGDITPDEAAAAIERHGLAVERIHVAIDLIEPYVRAGVAAGALRLDTPNFTAATSARGLTTTEEVNP